MAALNNLWGPFTLLVAGLRGFARATSRSLARLLPSQIGGDCDAEFFGRQLHHFRAVWPGNDPAAGARAYLVDRAPLGRWSCRRFPAALVSWRPQERFASTERVQDQIAAWSAPVEPISTGFDTLVAVLRMRSAIIRSRTDTGRAAPIGAGHRGRLLSRRHPEHHGLRC